ncbi:MAG: YabP/YqfC family sporulation protein [Bacilli bacterium]
MHKKLIDYIVDNEGRLTLFKNRLHVINYTKILTLEEERIAFLTNDLRYIVKGKNLVVKRLLNDEILIIGDITKIEVGAIC